LRMCRSWKYARRTDATARRIARTPKRRSWTEMVFDWLARLGHGSVVAVAAGWMREELTLTEWIESVRADGAMRYGGCSQLSQQSNDQAGWKALEQVR